MNITSDFNIVIEDSSESDGVISDVHVHPGKPPKLENENFYVSRYAIRTHNEISHETSTLLERDEDGDFVPVRKRKTNTGNYISIVHQMDTPLHQVGLQVWRGAMILADYIIHNNKLFSGTVVELGCGCGFSGLVASRYSNNCYLTDTGDRILENCLRNVSINILDSEIKNRIKIREFNFDWNLAPTNEAIDKSPFCSLLDLSSHVLFNWSKDDINIFTQSNITFFGSDIIYSNCLTSKLFSQLKILLNPKWKRVSMLRPPEGPNNTSLEETNVLDDKIYFYLAIEKRINFSLETLQDSSEEYDYFRSFLDDGDNNNNSNNQNKLFKAVRVTLDFSQYFEYERVEELELWRIWLK